MASTLAQKHLRSIILNVSIVFEMQQKHLFLVISATESATLLLLRLHTPMKYPDEYLIDQFIGCP